MWLLSIILWRFAVTQCIEWSFQSGEKFSQISKRINHRSLLFGNLLSFLESNLMLFHQIRNASSSSTMRSGHTMHKYVLSIINCPVNERMHGIEKLGNSFRCIHLAATGPLWDGKPKVIEIFSVFKEVLSVGSLAIHNMVDFVLLKNLKALSCSKTSYVKFGLRIRMDINAC